MFDSTLSGYNKYMKKIMHVDLDAFFCAVEEYEDPELRGKCFAVGGKPNQRGVVASCSYAARRFGVHSAMAMQKAQRLCPQLIAVSGRHRSYSKYSKHVMAILQQSCDKMSQISIDEAFLDLSSQDEPVELLGRRIQKRINQEAHLPCSLGIATNKLVAKIANDFGKSKYKGFGFPNAITFVPPGKEAEFLEPLPVRRLWGIGPKTAEKLGVIGISTIGDLAVADAEELFNSFGVYGVTMIQHAKGIDEREVGSGGSKSKSISSESTFSDDVVSEIILHDRIQSIAKGVAKRMRSSNLRATTIKVKIRWKDFTTITRQRTIALSDDENLIAQVALDLFRQEWKQSRPVRLIGVGVSGLVEKSQQPNLWDEEVKKKQELFNTMSLLQEKFGRSVVTTASKFKYSNTNSTKKKKK